MRSVAHDLDVLPEVSFDFLTSEGTYVHVADPRN